MVEAAEALVLLVRSDLEGRLVPRDLRVTLVILARRAIRVFEDPPVLLGHRALPDLRGMQENVDQKGLGVFKVLPDPLVELEEPQFLDQKALGVPPVLLAPRALQDPRATKASKVLLDPPVLPEQTGNQDSRAIMVRLVLPDLLGPRVLPDLLESEVLLVRMR